MYVTNYILADHQDELSSYSDLKKTSIQESQSLHSVCQDGMNGAEIGCGTRAILFPEPKRHNDLTQ